MSGRTETGEQHRRRRAQRRRLVTGLVSVAGHASVLAALILGRPEPPKPLDMQLMTVTLVEAPRPIAPSPAPKPEDAPPKATQVTPPKPTPVKPPPRKAVARKTPAPPPEVEPLPSGDEKAVAEGTDEVSDAELASATTAGSGSSAGAGSGDCNMTRWLQSALRKDPMVQSAVAEAHRGKAIRVWNGEWVRHPGQEGNGLAAVREAIMWEVAFAPVACRAKPVRGLVMISLNDGPGAARIVFGSGQWRWSDLLHARPGMAAETLRP